MRMVSTISSITWKLLSVNVMCNVSMKSNSSNNFKEEVKQVKCVSKLTYEVNNCVCQSPNPKHRKRLLADTLVRWHRVLINSTFQCLSCTGESHFDPCLCTFSHFSISLQNTFVSGCLDRLETASMCCLNNPTNVGQHWSQHPQNLPPQKRDWVKLTETHGETHEHTHTHTNTQKRDWVKSTETPADGSHTVMSSTSTKNLLVSGVDKISSCAGVGFPM